MKGESTDASKIPGSSTSLGGKLCSREKSRDRDGVPYRTNYGMQCLRLPRGCGGLFCERGFDGVQQEAGVIEERTFLEECGGAFLQEFVFVFLREAGEDEDWDVCREGIGFKLLQNLRAAEFGQEHVENDEIREFAVA